MQNTGSTSLSVGEAVTIRRGHPWMAVVLVGGLLLMMIGLVVGLVRVARPHDASDARAAATEAVSTIAAAETGDPRACARLGPFVAGPHGTTRRECRALLGDDPDARLHHLRATSTHIAAERGTVHLTGTVTGRHGTRPLAVDVPVTEVGGRWQLDWDGAPVLP